jgi:peptidoglycan/LPS O-acetylase OafA/YrhL
MKTKTLLSLLISIVVIISLGVWMYFSLDGEFLAGDLLHAGIIILLVAFAGIIGFQRFRSEKRGEPAEDEFSKKVMRRAASTSFYVSLYWWLVFAYISENWQMEGGSLIGRGIMGMAIIFAISWFYYKWKGVSS